MDYELRTAQVWLETKVDATWPVWLSEEALLDFLYDSGDGWEHHCPEEWKKNPEPSLDAIPEWWWAKMQFSPEVRAEMESLWALDPAFEVEWE